MWVFKDNAMAVGIDKYLLMENYLHLLAVATDSEGILEKISYVIPFLCASCFKGYLAVTLDLHVD